SGLQTRAAATEARPLLHPAAVGRRRQYPRRAEDPPGPQPVRPGSVLEPGGRIQPRALQIRPPEAAPVPARGVTPRDERIWSRPEKKRGRHRPDWRSANALELDARGRSCFSSSTNAITGRLDRLAPPRFVLSPGRLLGRGLSGQGVGGGSHRPGRAV